MLDPPYLTEGRPRPRIAEPPSGGIRFERPFDLTLVEAPPGPLEVVLMAFGSTVVGQNVTQSHLQLAATRSADGRRVTAMGPASRALTPPGRYLLFVLDAAGIPSVGVPVALTE